MAEGEIGVRHGLADRLAHQALMGGVHIGMQQADRHGLHALGLEGLDGGCERRGVQRLMFVAGGQQAPVDLAGEGAGHQRLGPLEEEIVGLRPIAAPDGVDVARAARHDQPGLRALALDQGVDGGGGAVDQLRDIADLKPALVQAVNDALHQIAGRRQALGLQEPLFLRVKADQIREGSANVDCHDDHVGHLPFPAPPMGAW